jgi:hypothetical protein
MSIDYAFRPRLRSRLTLGGFTLPRNPWAFGEGILTPLSLLKLAYSLPTLHYPFRERLHRMTGTLPYRSFPSPQLRHKTYSR